MKMRKRKREIPKETGVIKTLGISYLFLFNRAPFLKEEEGRWKIGGRRKKETGRTRGATNRHAIPR